MLDVPIIVSIFCLLCLILSGWGEGGKSIKNFEQFALAKSKFSNIMIIATIIATLFGGGTYMGNMEQAYIYGITPMVAGLFTAGQQFATGYFFAEPLQKYKGAITIGDIFACHYGQASKIFVGLVSVVFTIGIVIVQIKVLDQAMASFCVGYNHKYLTMASSAIVVSYCFLGGIRAVVITDCLQLTAMLLVVPVLAIFLVTSAGGISGCIEKTPVSFWQVPAGMSVGKFIGALVGFAVGDMLIPPVVQRLLMAKNGATARRTMIVGSFGALFLILCAGMIGIASAALMPYYDSESTSFISALLNNSEVIPRTFMPLIVAGLFAVLVSTTDSYLNTSCISFVHDVVKPINPNLDDKMALFLVKLVTICSGAGAILFAISDIGIYNLLLAVFNLWGPFLVVPFVGLLFGYLVTQTGFFVSSISGGLTSGYWMYNSLEDITSIEPIVAGMSVCLIVFTLFYWFDSVELREEDRVIAN